VIAELPSFLAIALVGFGCAFNSDLFAEEIGIVAESCASPVTTIKAMANIHDQWLSVGYGA
jgi:hypothetical protein